MAVAHEPSEHGLKMNVEAIAEVAMRLARGAQTRRVASPHSSRGGRVRQTSVGSRIASSPG